MRVGSLMLKLDDEYYTQIGAIVAKWATLEFQMMVIIWRAIGLENEAGRVLTVGMGTQVLCGILRNIPKKWVADDRVEKAILDLVQAVSDNADGRNHLVHGIWTALPNEPAPYLNFMKQGHHRILPAGQAIKPEELAHFSKVLDSLNHAANQICGVLGEQIALPDIPDEQNPAGLPTQTQTLK